MDKNQLENLRPKNHRQPAFGEKLRNSSMEYDQLKHKLACFLTYCNS